ncbi:MAG: EAL domain-containing protein [Aquificaceae bacterium]|nr:EAL domain-containing protein [Aquificaceae bacterium]MDW8237691.1 EAL domain-containing protein [Aquificaceae bacterium]
MLKLSIYRVGDSPRASAGLVFYPGPEEDLSEIRARILPYEPEANIVFISAGAGVIEYGKVHTNRAIVVFFHKPIEILTISSEEEFSQAYLIFERASSALVFSDYPSGVLLEKLVSELESAGVMIAGAVASDNLSFKNTFVYINDKKISGIVAMLFESKESIFTDWYSSTYPLGIKMQISKSKGRVATIVNGMPVKVYFELFLEELNFNFLNSFFVSTEENLPHKRQPHASLGLSEEGLIFAKSIESGKELELAVYNHSLSQAIAQSLEEYFEKTEFDLCLVFMCIGKVLAIGSDNVELSALSNKGVVGMLTFAEVSMNRTTPSFLNLTTTLCIFNSRFPLLLEPNYSISEHESTIRNLALKITERQEGLLSSLVKQFSIAILDDNGKALFYDKKLLLHFDSEEDFLRKLSMWAYNCKKNPTPEFKLRVHTYGDTVRYFRISCMKSGNHYYLIIEDFTRYASLEYLERNMMFHPITELPTQYSITKNKKAWCISIDVAFLSWIKVNNLEEIAREILQELAQYLSNFAKENDMEIYNTLDGNFHLISPVSSKEEMVNIAQQLHKKLTSMSFTSTGLNLDFYIMVSYGKPPEIIELFSEFIHQRKNTDEVFVLDEVKEELTKTPTEFYKSTRAVEARRLQVTYQPIVNINSGQIYAYEALVRLFSSNGDKIAIPWQAFRKTSQYRKLTKEVLRKALILSSQKNIKVHVNLSWEDILNTDRINEIRKLIKEFRLERELVSLELVEWSEYPVNKLRDAFSHLREFAFVGLDDFGIGVYDLATLVGLEFDYVKFDRAFIMFLKDKRTLNFVSGLVKSFKEVKVQTVAEGVESEEELELCKKAGFELAQGRFFGEPTTEV